MKTFDFNHPDFFKNSKERQKFYKDFYDKPITEDQFVAIVASWPKGNSNRRKPSKSRYMYKKLKNNFGFFQGT